MVVIVLVQTLPERGTIIIVQLQHVSYDARYAQLMDRQVFLYASNTGLRLMLRLVIFEPNHIYTAENPAYRPRQENSLRTHRFVQLYQSSQSTRTDALLKDDEWQDGHEM